MTPILEVRDLSVEFHTRDGVARAVDRVGLRLEPGEVLAVLGESGSGKSVTAQAIMGVLHTPPARVTGGEILYQGRDLLRMSEPQRRRVRGREIGMIFQDALSALDPVFSVGFQLSEALRHGSGMSRSAARARTAELMDLVRIPDARRRLRDYPHQLSGGMRQRVMIALALAQNPKVLIADEPTTALDVTVRAQIMDLLGDLRRSLGMAMILITHDLGVVAGVADRIVIMYAGRTVEQADVYQLYEAPGHPYTRGLLGSVPRLAARRGPLPAIEGAPPSPMRIPRGCAFHPRCPHATEVCRSTPPPRVPLGAGRYSDCHYAAQVAGGLI
ncbi:ABC transporter ATP-binding protein [Rugosimonospora acidiphila]|uniref:ABC transporter ATP-binding protein n=1 Tax=Rugosimonospora acidiphila TaxID=556531 RepID=A0ABP9RJS4_9ACTN